MFRIIDLGLTWWLFIIFHILNHISNNRFEIDKFLKLVDSNTLVILPWKTHDKKSADIYYSIQCHLHEGIIKHRFVSCHTIYFLSMIFVWGWQYSYISRINHYNTKHRIYTSMITKLTKMIMISIREHLQ